MREANKTGKQKHEIQNGIWHRGDRLDLRVLWDRDNREQAALV